MDGNTQFAGVRLLQPDHTLYGIMGRGVRGREMMTLQDDSQDHIYRHYARSLELVLRVYKQAETVHFESVYALGNYLGCDDTQTVIRILRQLSERYHLNVTFDDYGVSISNGSLKG